MKRTLNILATGTYLPNQRVCSSKIDKRLGKKEGWTKRLFGIDERYYASKEETTSYMGAKAAMQALQRANTQPDEIDCIISACGVMEQPIPSTSVLIQNKLGLGHSAIPCFDVNATCLSFVKAMDIAADGLTLGRYKKILIVSSEIASCGLNWDSPEAAAIFGDGAAAVLVSASDTKEGSMFTSHMETYGAWQDVCTLKSGGTGLLPSDDREAFEKGTKFYMDGPEVLKTTLTYIPAFLEKLLAMSGLTMDDIALIVPHQASAFSLRALHTKLGLDQDKMVNIFAHYGNQIAASIPYTLNNAIETGRLSRGDNIMLVGTSAGISVGGIILQY